MADITEKDITMVVITKKEYEKLLHAYEHLEFLKSRGVDNWDGYRSLPDPDEDLDDEDKYND